MTAAVVCIRCDRAIHADEFDGHRCIPLVDRQPREHAVPCRRCHRPTFAISAYCEACTAKAA